MQHGMEAVYHTEAGLRNRKQEMIGAAEVPGPDTYAGSALRFPTN